jgi:hypothetical protein
LRRTLTAAFLLAALSSAAHTQQRPIEQVTVSINPAAIPAPDPNSWWTDEWPEKPEAMDPLKRRLRRGERPPGIEIQNGVPPLLYRLWNLPPIQDQPVRRGEAVVEMWARPAETVRQAIVRVVLRGDGRAFVQGRAGYGCCEPEISRLVMFDQELPPERAAAVRAIIQDPVWGEPRLAAVVEDGATVDLLCVNGVSYDVNLVVPGGARSLHRACSGEQVGSIAPVLTALLSAALGYEPRFDVVFPRGAGFESERRDYQALLARGGSLRPAPNNREQPALVPEPPLEAFEEPQAPTPSPATP